MPALDLFYSLVICQGVLMVMWKCMDIIAEYLVISVCEKCKFPTEWGIVSVVEYLLDTRAKCKQDPASIKGSNLVSYAVDLLDSRLQQDYISGARMLDVFIEQGVDVRSLLLPLRPNIQKLIDTLGLRNSHTETRKQTARIVAYLASDIHLTQFPGAIQSISSLLDTTQPYWNNQQEPNHLPPQTKLKKHYSKKEYLISCIKERAQRRAKRRRNQEGDDQQGEVDSEGDSWNELILQGLTIFERLASDQHNCCDIYSSPDLLPRIMAPLYSSTLIQDMNVSGHANVVNGSFRVVHQLIRAPGWTGRRLRHEISYSEPAVSNLEKILDQGNKAGHDLQMRAIEILRELALDLSTNLAMETKENLIKKQLQIFLTDEEEEDEPTTMLIKKKLKVTAGKTVALLSKTETISAFIMREYSDIIDRLTEILDSKNSIIYATISAQMLENMCTHYMLDKEHVKDTLLPKVLTEVLTSTRKSKAPEYNEEINEHSSEEDDEEKQLSVHSDHMESSDQANEEETAMMELQEALLSLTLVICDKLIGTDDFNDVARKIAPREGEFMAKLKDLVEENFQATASCVRIVKLCGQNAVRMMRRNQHTVHSKDQEFIESLSKALEIMSNLESWMFYAGTYCGVKKTVRPFLLDLVKELREAVESVG